MKDQIVKLAEAFRNNKEVLYKGKNVMYAYLAGMNFNTGEIVIRYANLETEKVDIMDLEVK